MVVLYDTTRNEARVFHLDTILEDELIKRYIQFGFSEEMAKSVTNDILETVVYPNYQCVIKNGKELHSLNCKNGTTTKINMESIVPTQTTCYGKQIFDEIVSEYLKCIDNFEQGFFGKILKNPVIALRDNEIHIEEKSIADSNALRSILSDYFSNNTLENITEETCQLVADGLTIESNLGILTVTRDSDNFKIVKPENSTSALQNLILKYLNGYNKFYEVIYNRLYNYIVFRTTIQTPYQITHITDTWMFTLINGVEYFAYRKKTTNFNRLKSQEKGSYWYGVISLPDKNFFEQMKQQLNSPGKVLSYVKYLHHLPADANEMITTLLEKIPNYHLISELKYAKNTNPYWHTDYFQSISNGDIHTCDTIEKLISNLSNTQTKKTYCFINAVKMI